MAHAIARFRSPWRLEAPDDINDRIICIPLYRCDVCIGRMQHGNGSGSIPIRRNLHRIVGNGGCMHK